MVYSVQNSQIATYLKSAHEETKGEGVLINGILLLALSVKVARTIYVAVNSDRSVWLLTEVRFFSKRVHYFDCIFSRNVEADVFDESSHMIFSADLHAYLIHP